MLLLRLTRSRESSVRGIRTGGINLHRYSFVSSSLLKIHFFQSVFVDVHSRLNHPNIVELIGAGLTSKGVRFIILERLDGGTLTQMLGYDTRIRDRRRRFWRKKQLAYLDVLRCARSIASAMQYCHEMAIPGSIVLHRDLKPDNIVSVARQRCRVRTSYR